MYIGAIFLGVPISIMMNNWMGLVAGALLGAFMGYSSGYGKAIVQQQKDALYKNQ